MWRMHSSWAGPECSADCACNLPKRPTLCRCSRGTGSGCSPFRKRLSDNGVIHPESLDYTNLGALDAALKRVIQNFGVPSLVVAWMDSHAPDAIGVLAHSVSQEPPTCRFFHERGSAAANPAETGSEIRERIQRAGSVLYREVMS